MIPMCGNMSFFRDCVIVILLDVPPFTLRVVEVFGEDVVPLLVRLVWFWEIILSLVVWVLFFDDVVDCFRDLFVDVNDSTFFFNALVVLVIVYFSTIFMFHDILILSSFVLFVNTLCIMLDGNITVIPSSGGNHSECEHLVLSLRPSSIVFNTLNC